MSYMAEILIITHGNLAREMVDIVEQIIERPIKVTAVCLDLAADRSTYTRQLEQALAAFDPDSPVLVLTDLFGGTPSNIAFPFVKKDRLEVITGFNLPMLLYLLTQPPNKCFRDLCDGAVKAGKDAIIVAGRFMD
jgi:mannose PTS system EIIA component